MRDILFDTCSYFHSAGGKSPFASYFPAMDNKRQNLILGALFLLAFGLRLARILETSYLDKDAVLYISMAERLADGRVGDTFGLIPRLPPLYPTMIASLCKFGVGAEFAGLSISLLAGSILIFPVFSLSKYFFGVNAGLVSAFLAATQPYLVRDSAEIMRDSLFFLILFCALRLISSAISQKSTLLLLISGVLVAFSTLTRSEGNEAILGFLAWLVLESFLALKKIGLLASLKNFFTAAFAISAGFMLTALPAQIVLQNHGSAWTMADPRIFGYMDSFLKFDSNSGEEK